MGPQWQTSDPFLFCAFHHDHFPQGDGKCRPNTSLDGRYLGQDFNQKDGWAMYHGRTVPGFPPHPHAGFETVTIAEKGFVDHADSLNASGRFGNGDVQWMTAGKGVQHSEMFPLLDTEERNELVLFQIWLNLPKAKKDVDPYFGMFWNENIPVVTMNDENGITSKVKIVAGNYKETKALHPAPDSWAANAEADINIWIIEIGAGGTFTLPKTQKETNRSLYFYDGDTLIIEDYEVPPIHRIQLHPETDAIIKAGEKPAKLVLLQGKPIGENVIQHGPFVANSREGINDIMMRFRENEFGGWPWNPEQTHGPDKKRFATFPDGHTETP